ncbi:MAG: hypothetical protein ACRD4S_12690 [Candidatus Acidiferrales bacterium]
MFTVSQAAAKSGIDEGLLILWISTGKFRPSIASADTSAGLTGIGKQAFESYAGPDVHAFGWQRFALTDDDLKRLRVMVEETAERVSKNPTHVAGTHYSVQELAALWGFSPDTIRELFESESGVLVVGQDGNRRKRGYRTLRIPESVAVRVQRRLSNL